MRKLKYTHTLGACFAAYTVQAIVNIFAPLLFVRFGTEYGIPLGKITALVAVNFAVQLTVDLTGVFFADKIGYRRLAVTAHVFAAAGLIMLGTLPDIFDPFTGIVVSVAVYALGGGTLEVIVSPITEACPTKNKDRVMALMHSSYCWGSVLIIGLSVLYFTLFGIENWRYLALIWAALPVANGIFFMFVPMYPLIKEGETGLKLSELMKSGCFWIFVVMMFATGASEQGISQWASSFAESGLGVSKTVGDLVGPMTFAVLMGTSRVLYARFGSPEKLTYMLAGSAAISFAAYLAAALSSEPVVALIGTAAAGFGTGILWPGTFSLGSATLKRGGTAMFSLFALAGDLGCMAGPTVIGAVADAANGSLAYGLGIGALFPALMLLATVVLTIAAKKKRGSGDDMPGADLLT